MACNNSCAAQIACALAVAAATYMVNVMLDRANTQSPARRMHQFEMVPPTPPEPPLRYCTTLPSGRRYCCEHGWPQGWRRTVRTRHGLRVRWYATCV